MSRKYDEVVEAEDDKRIIKTRAHELTDDEILQKIAESEDSRSQKIYVGEEPAEIERTRLGRIIQALLENMNEDEEIQDFMSRARKDKSMLLIIVDKDGESHGIAARADGGMAIYRGEEGYDVVCRMYEDTFLDLLLGEIDINYAFAANYIIFEGVNWLLHSEVLRAMFNRFRKAITGRKIVSVIKQVRSV